MIKNTEMSHETDHTNEAVCPHCGQALQSTMELFCDNTQLDGAETFEDCERCGKPYQIRRNVDVTYTTTKTEGATNV